MTFVSVSGMRLLTSLAHPNVAHALVRAASTLVSKPGHKTLPPRRRDESRRGTHECVRYLALVFLTLPCSAATLTFHISGDDPGGWPSVLSSIGLQNTSAHGDVEII